MATAVYDGLQAGLVDGQRAFVPTADAGGVNVDDGDADVGAVVGDHCASGPTYIARPNAADAFNVKAA